MREMKDSGVPWIGNIPVDWNVSIVLSEFEEVKNINKGMLEKNLLSLSYGNIVRKEINSNNGLLPNSFETYNVIPQNSIVLRLTDLQNDKRSLRSAICNEQGIITSAYTTIQLKSNIENHPRYMNYLFRCYDDCKVFYGLGNGVRQSINYSELKRVAILKPSYNCQMQIAKYLDTKCTQIDTIIAKEQSVIEKLQEYKQAIITQVITRGLNSSTKMKKTRLEWIGMIPEHWNVKKIKYLTSKIGSGKTPKGGSDVYIDEGILFIRSQNVHDGYFDLSSAVFISPEIDCTMSNTRVYRDDVLLNITGGSIGRACLYESDELANVNQHVCIIRCNSQMRPKFMQYFWNSSIGKTSIDIYQSGANREGLNFFEIGNTVVPTPELDEQEQIIDYLDDKCDTIDRVISQKLTIIDTLTEYKRSLIYEVVTGKKEVPHV